MTLETTLRIRQVFFNTNSTLLNLNMNSISVDLTKAWTKMVNLSILLNNSVIQVIALNQDLYYDERYFK